MIKYHILSLLALAVVAITAIEAAAEFYTSEHNLAGSWYSNIKAWIMVLVCLASVVLYFRARTYRKRETLKN